MSFSLPIPVLDTERLRLRAPEMADFEGFAAFCATPRAVGIGGPYDRPTVWQMLATFAGGWMLTGMGWWAVALRGRPEAAIGFVGVHHPPHKAERELGWLLYETAEGNGFAREAAVAARDWARAKLSAATLVSYILNDNARSGALARSLGAWPDGPAVHNAAATVWRHPAAAEGQA